MLQLQVPSSSIVRLSMNPIGIVTLYPIHTHIHSWPHKLRQTFIQTQMARTDQPWTLLMAIQDEGPLMRNIYLDNWGISTLYMYICPTY